MATSNPQKLGLEILEALGLENHTIRRFTLRVGINEVPMIECEHVVPDDKGEVSTVLRRYEVHEAEGGKNESR